MPDATDIAAAMRGQDRQSPSERLAPLEVLSLFPAHAATLWGLLESRARFGHDRLLLLYQGRVCSYGHVVERASALSTSLSAHGVAKGDRLAIMSTNSDEYVLLLLALARLGAKAHHPPADILAEPNFVDAGHTKPPVAKT